VHLRLRRTRGQAPPRLFELSWWELALCLPLVLLVTFFVLARAFVAAVVLTALIAVMFSWRAEIVERNVAGGYARLRGWLLVTQWVAMAALYLVVMGILIVANIDHWTRTRAGTVAVYACGGLIFFLAREMMRRGDEAINYLVGGEAEVKVAEVLNSQRELGWDVIHDIKKDWGGNLDHLVLAPNAAFAIETKSGGESGRARGQALANAAWAKEKYARRWVNAVLCVLTDPPSGPKKVGQAWVVGIGDLLPLLDRLAGTTRP
jgi:hypothetical protein